MLVNLMEEHAIKLALTLRGVGLLQALGKLRAAADIDAEAAGGPQQELHIALHIAIVCLSHLGRAVDEGMMDGDTLIVTLYSDGNGLLGILEISLTPHTEGNKGRIQLGSMFHLIINT